jgi:hypothetical protein
MRIQSYVRHPGLGRSEMLGQVLTRLSRCRPTTYYPTHRSVSRIVIAASRAYRLELERAAGHRLAAGRGPGEEIHAAALGGPRPAEGGRLGCGQRTHLRHLRGRERYLLGYAARICVLL